MNQRARSIWIGFDPREAHAFAVARESIRCHRTLPVPVYALVLARLQEEGLYRRPTERVLGQIRDLRSVRPGYNGNMSTEFALSRFLVPMLAGSGLALFMDCDVLVRTDLSNIFDQIDRRFAVSCVKHSHAPSSSVKMDGQVQTSYPRKNWSSVMVFNCDHPANRRLTPEMFNERPGVDLHQFCWLQDDEIGDLDVSWNWLVRESPPVDDPKIVHFTNGIPTMLGFENDAYADEWREVLYHWASPHADIGVRC